MNAVNPKSSQKHNSIIKQFFVLILLILSTNSLFAISFTVNGINYSTLSDSTVQVDYGNYIGNIVLPSNIVYSNVNYKVKVISLRAFYKKSGLTSLTIPSTVTEIGDYAFYNCTGLTTLNMPTSLKTIGNFAFYNCSSISNLTLPASVVSIGEYAFYLCSGVKSVIIPPSVNMIGDFAFSQMELIEVDTLNQSFASLNGILYNKSFSKIFFCPSSRSGEFIIPPTVTSIAAGAFFNCTQLISIIIPESVTIIGDFAFCFSNAVLNIDPNNTSFVCQNDVLYNKSMSTLIQCPYAKKGDFIIPTTVTSIGNYAFVACSGLTSVSVPSGVCTIGVGAFSNCTSIKSINLPSSLSELSDWAFDNCTGLVSITLPFNLTKIGNYSFQQCSQLNSITLPSTLISIGDYAFRGCTNLKSVYMKSPTPISIKDNYVFDYSLTSNSTSYIPITLYVPIGSKQAYQSELVWKDFSAINEYNATSLQEINHNIVKAVYKTSTQSIQLIGDDGNYPVEIFDSNGALLLNKTLQTNTPFSIKSLSSGIYIVRILSGRNYIIDKIVIK